MRITPRSLALLAALAALAPSPLRAQAQRNDPEASPPPEELTAGDALTIAMLSAPLDAGMFAFAVGIEAAHLDALGPVGLRYATIGLTGLGLVGSHAAALSLLSPSLRGSPRARAVLAGVSLVSTGLSLIGFSLPTAWAMVSDPPSGEESIAIAIPFLAAAIGLANVVIGTVMIAEARDPIEIGLAASPDAGVISIRRTF